MKNQIDKNKIPKEVFWICENLFQNNFESFLVGGCVRDLFLSKEPKDWDITTNAKPEEIIKIFGENNTIYENNFGTVGIKIKSKEEKKQNGESKTEKIVEITTYRKEGEYKDFRKPEKVEWGNDIEEDLLRRDFTMNAIGYDIINDKIVDPYKGQKDINDKIIRCVGNVNDRFNEDALRIIRAIRFFSELNFTISAEIISSIFNLKDNLKNISQERIRDEFIKIIMSENGMNAIVVSQKLGVLKYIIPELEDGIGIEQRGSHIYDVFEHNLRSFHCAVEKKYPFHIRLSALLHDIAKPITRRWDKNKKIYTFHGHEVVGERMAKKILERLKFSKDIIELVSRFVRWHMFFSDPEQVSISSVRRLIINIGKENIWDLINLRICDRVGTGRPNEEPYRLRAFEAMIEEAMTDNLSLKMLKINGEKIMSFIEEKPGPKIGFILNALFNEVIDDPKKNTEEYLKEKCLELNRLDIKEIKKLSESGKEKMEEENENKKKEIKSKFRVK